MSREMGHPTKKRTETIITPITSNRSTDQSTRPVDPGPTSGHGRSVWYIQNRVHRHSRNGHSAMVGSGVGVGTPSDPPRPPGEDQVRIGKGYFID